MADLRRPRDVNTLKEIEFCAACVIRLIVYAALARRCQAGTDFPLAAP
jgi:hypothetical protein